MVQQSSLLPLCLFHTSKPVLDMTSNGGSRRNGCFSSKLGVFGSCVSHLLRHQFTHKQKKGLCDHPFIALCSAPFCRLSRIRSRSKIPSTLGLEGASTQTPIPCAAPLKNNLTAVRTRAALPTASNPSHTFRMMFQDLGWRTSWRNPTLPTLSARAPSAAAPTWMPFLRALPPKKKRPKRPLRRLQQRPCEFPARSSHGHQSEDQYRGAHHDHPPSYLNVFNMSQLLLYLSCLVRFVVGATYHVQGFRGRSFVRGRAQHVARMENIEGDAAAWFTCNSDWQADPDLSDVRRTLIFFS